MKTTTTTTTTRPPALRLLAILYIFCLFAPMAAGQGAPTTPTYWDGQIGNVDRIANNEGGTGTSWNDAILIASAKELAYFAQQVNKGEPIVLGSGGDPIKPKDKDEAGGFKGYYFALSADIDLKDHYWTPIGINGSNPFKGNFDGQGHCVSGLKVDVNGNVYVGLFGDTYVGTIQNLGVCVAKEGIRGAVHCAGGIAGRAQNVHNCYVVGEGSIEINGGGDGYAGGIVGYLQSNGSLTNCYATVDIRIENNGRRYAGGIVGYCSYNSTISCTYATGDVEAGTGDKYFYTGGICGYLFNGGTIENSLALNGRIAGGSGFSNRIVGDKEDNASLTTNYASPVILVNDKTSADNLVDNKNGASTWPGSFEADLKKEPAGDANGWATSWTFTSDYLPQLKKKTADGKYEAWTSKQPQLMTKLYLPSRLHIVSSTGGTLTVTDGAGNPLADGSAVMSGTQLKLAYAEDANYQFSEYLSGSDEGSLKSYDSNSITMPDADLYLSATFTLYPKLHIVSPTGGTLKVTDKDGNELLDGSDIRPGTLLTLANTEADNYRFSGYLSGSDKDNLKSYDSNSITMPDADLYLSATFTLYPKLQIVASTGGTLTVTDKDGNKLPDGSNILPGTVLTLANTEEANYYFSEYLSGSDKGSLKSYGSNSITMPDADLYLSATFTLYPKLHIVSPTGGTLKVTDKDGNELLDGSDIRPGTLLTLANTEDANYHFSEYLSGSDKGSLKSYDSNSITMPDADLYLSATFTLYPKLQIVASTGGTLTVTDKDGKELPDGSYIRPGTLLTLAYTEDTNYRFSEYLSGSDGDNLNSHASNSITMPDADLYLSATFTYQEPEPPYVPPVPVYYNVYLPQVEGATTDPGPGEHEVESWETFRFYLTIDSAYSESQPVVTTDRGETLQPRSSDGAYLVKYVRSDVEVFIDGIFKNLPPVANEAISTDALVPQIWAEGSMLCIRMAEALPSTPVSIYTTNGRLHDSFASTPGLNCRQLPTNIYIVRIGDTACKVIIK